MDAGTNIVFTESNLKLLETVLKQEGIDGIYYAVRLSSTEKVGTSNYISFSQDYTMDTLHGNQSFQIHGKIDTSVFYSNNEFNDIVEGWIKEIEKGKGTRFTSKSGRNFVEINQSEPKPTKEELLIKDILKQLSEQFNITQEEFDKWITDTSLDVWNSNLPIPSNFEDTLQHLLNNHGFIWYKVGSSNVIKKISDNQDLKVEGLEFSTCSFDIQNRTLTIVYDKIPPIGYEYVKLKNIQGIIDNAEELNKILVSKNGHNIFQMDCGGRTFVIANVNGVIIPFYQSAHGTDGKIKGAWYPFFGMTGNWLVKGAIESNGQMNYSPEIDRITKLLNSSLHLDSTKPVKKIAEEISEFKAFTFQDRFPELYEQYGPNVSGLQPIAGTTRKNGATGPLDSQMKMADAVFVEEITGIDASNVVNGTTNDSVWISGRDHINLLLELIKNNNKRNFVFEIVNGNLELSEINSTIVNNETIQIDESKIDDELMKLDDNIKRRIGSSYNELNQNIENKKISKSSISPKFLEKIKDAPNLIAYLKSIFEINEDTKPQPCKIII